MNKRFLSFLPLVGALCSCMFINFDTRVEEYGNAHFKDPLLIDWLYLDEELYYYCGQLDKEVELEEVASFNTEYNGYYVFKMNQDEYPGCITLGMKDIFETFHSVYVREDAQYVDCSLLFDMPHKDSFLDGGKNLSFNGKEYSTYYCAPEYFKPGKMIGEENKTPYYSVEEADGWICYRDDSVNRYELCFPLTISELPVSIIKLVRTIDIYN